MKQFILYTAALCFMLSTIEAQTYTPTAENLANRAMFQDMKFGMFIHWGAFSVLGDGEWVMNNRNIHVNEYDRLLHIFNPTQFDAKAWVDAAKSGGMKYITLITRHHDGFSNWDTKQSYWKITNTPYGKDVVKQLADECHKQGIKLFLYYSLLDWHRTDYAYEAGRTGKGTGRTTKSDMPAYINFMKAQLTELLSNYGTIDGIWFDGYWDQIDDETDKLIAPHTDWHMDEIYALIHKLQPACLIGNNHHRPPLAGEDFQMFEKDLPGGNTTGFGGQPTSVLPLETCETMNGSWGFNITDRDFKSVKTLIQYMVNDAGRNANFLLNIGPMPNGVIQTEFTDTLKAMGLWMQKYGESIYGTRGGSIKPQDWGVVTTKAHTLYVHILNKPQDTYIFIPGVKDKITKAYLMGDKTPIRFKQQPEGVFVYLDGVKLDNIDTIIQFEVKN